MVKPFIDVKLLMVKLVIIKLNKAPKNDGIINYG